MSVMIISSTIVADSESAEGLEQQLLLSGMERSSIQLQAGERYRFITDVDSVPIDGVIALRFTDDLKLQFADDEAIVLKNYFTLCAEKKCIVEMALEKNAEGELLYFSLSADSVGLDLGDGSQLLLAYGDVAALMQLAQGQVVLSQTISQAQGKHLALGDVLAEVEITSESANEGDDTNFTAIGLGALLLYGVAISSSGGGGSDSQGAGAQRGSVVSIDPQESALQAIEMYQVGSQALVVEDFLDAGVSGVTVKTLDAVSNRIAAVADGAADTVEEVQALVDAGAFISTWRLTADTPEIVLDVSADALLNYKFDVDWNKDGDFNDVGEFGLTDSVSHSLEYTGDYDIRIRGDYPYMPSQSYPPNTTHPLIDIKQWGDNAWQNMSGMFATTLIANFSATDTPNIDDVTDMSSMFIAAENFNHDISHWDVSAVTNMESMFEFSDSFNQDVGGWNVSSVTSMESMFTFATNFNQDIGDWDVSAVTEMDGMFTGAADFNQDIGDWDVSAVIEMEGMFEDATNFNQDIGDWDVSAVTEMEGMFTGADDFNQDIGDWDVSAVTSMEDMFGLSSNLSVLNYDSLLSGWSDINFSTGEKTLVLDVLLGVDNLSYTNATARDYLQTGWNWSMTGDSLEAGIIVGDDTADTLGDSGSNADQIIHGLGGSDTITGGSGHDLIYAGDGDNTLTGNEGVDTFVYSNLRLWRASVSDTITDFDLNEDILDLSVLLDGFGIAGYGDSANDFISLGADSNGKLQLGIDRNGSADDILGAYQLNISLANIVFDANTHTDEWLTDLHAYEGLVLI